MIVFGVGQGQQQGDPIECTPGTDVAGSDGSAAQNANSAREDIGIWTPRWWNSHRRLPTYLDEPGRVDYHPQYV
jgi:hypothetical protein